MANSRIVNGPMQVFPASGVGDRTLAVNSAASNFIVAALVLLGNLVSDLLYAVVDPRVRLE
jgi:ABC-type dipeptide/oligopeptide/nickel transport system permease component